MNTFTYSQSVINSSTRAECSVEHSRVFTALLCLHERVVRISWVNRRSVSSIVRLKHWQPCRVVRSPGKPFCSTLDWQNVGCRWLCRETKLVVDLEIFASYEREEFLHGYDRREKNSVCSSWHLEIWQYDRIVSGVVGAWLSWWQGGQKLHRRRSRIASHMRRRRSNNNNNNNNNRICGVLRWTKTPNANNCWWKSRIKLNYVGLQ